MQKKWNKKSCNKLTINLLQLFLFHQKNTEGVTTTPPH
jgi:hypothetical protein